MYMGVTHVDVCLSNYFKVSRVLFNNKLLQRVIGNFTTIHDLFLSDCNPWGLAHVPFH